MAHPRNAIAEPNWLGDYFLLKPIRTEGELVLLAMANSRPHAALFATDFSSSFSAP
jgi:hypothetical protein